MTLSVIQGSNRSLETLHRKTNKKKRAYWKVIFITIWPALEMGMQARSVLVTFVNQPECVIQMAFHS